MSSSHPSTQFSGSEQVATMGTCRECAEACFPSQAATCSRRYCESQTCARCLVSSMKTTLEDAQADASGIAGVARGSSILGKVCVSRTQMSQSRHKYGTVSRPDPTRASRIPRFWVLTRSRGAPVDSGYLLAPSCRNPCVQGEVWTVLGILLFISVTPP